VPRTRRSACAARNPIQSAAGDPISLARPGVFHLRTRRSRHEVDAVLERRGGQLVGVEAKAPATLSKHDFRGLEELRDSRGDDFAAGVVVHTGEQTLPFGEPLWALPASALWNGS
jgi:predicted AAA+ superfamily ATPase